MGLPDLAAPIAAALAGAASEVLGSRLVSLVAYGSAVSGDILPRYSDFDFAVAVSGPVTLDDALALERATGQLDIAPFTYCQPRLVGRSATNAVFVPSTFAVILGEAPPAAWIFDGGQLRTSGEEWLAGLPASLAQDATDWSFTTSTSRARRARLHLTRVKPSLRALLVRHGCDPVTAWTATWDELSRRLTEVDARAAEQLSVLLEAARAGDDRTVAIAALTLVGRVCVHHLGAGSPGFQIAP